MLASGLAKILGGRLLGDDSMITKVSPLLHALPGDVSLVIWPQNIRQAKFTQASCLITDINVAADYAHLLSPSLIVVEDFFEVFWCLKALLESGELGSKKPILRNNIGQNTTIGTQAIIENGAMIGQNCSIGPGAVIHKNVKMGDGCKIGANSVIGSDAFVPWGIEPSKNLPSLGAVVIEDQVSIGALCTIDRGLLGATVIKKQSLIDNMVHVGHDVEIGENVVIAAQSGLAGFAVVSDQATLGGQVGVVPFAHIGQGARISGKSLVHCDIKHHEIWSGNPSVPHIMYLRAYGRLKRMFKEKTGERFND
jgi:UDP-3-O-[3-hydroxymyristoyl] glucosamine N-acyltransferase